MTKSDLEELYKTACAGKGFKPTDGQFKVWSLTLGHLPKADLSQALVWWFTDHQEFPMPAELKPLAERARRSRYSTGKAQVRWKCPTCHEQRTGFLSHGEPTERACRSMYGPWRPGLKQGVLPHNPDDSPGICGEIMDIVEDLRGKG